MASTPTGDVWVARGVVSPLGLPATVGRGRARRREGRRGEAGGRGAGRAGAPHVRLLHLLAEAPPVRIMQGYEVRSLGWSREEIADRLPGLAEVLDPLVATLTGTALIENVGTVAGPGTITALRSSHETLRLWDGDALRAAVSAASQRRQGQLDRPGRLRVAGRGGY